MLHLTESVIYLKNTTTDDVFNGLFSWLTGYMNMSRGLIGAINNPFQTKSAVVFANHRIW